MAEKSCTSISFSLLREITVRPVLQRFSLGMEDFVEPHLLLPDPTYSSRSAPSQPHPVAKKMRFSTVSASELERLSEPFIPKQTEKATKWAVDNFSSWLEYNNSTVDGEKCPPNLLEDMTPVLLNKWLSVYIVETRKTNGELYPPATIHSLLSGLLRHMRNIDAQRSPNIFAKNDPRFQVLHTTMDSIYRQLRAQGVGATKHSAEVFSKEDENLLWSSGIIGINNPLSLQRAIFFYNGKNFCLRGGEEHRSLKLSQFTRNEDCYIYTENVSKNRAGGLAQLKLENKSVRIVRNPDAGNRCHCKLMDLYLSKLPTTARENDIFYLRPLEKFTPDGPWYSAVPVGRNKLLKMVPDMCKAADIKGHKTNHSLRATGATELYTAGVPEKIIKERTGHRSLECLRMYERTSTKQHKAVSRVLSSTSGTNYSMEMSNIEHK